MKVYMLLSEYTSVNLFHNIKFTLYTPTFLVTKCQTMETRLALMYAYTNWFTLCKLYFKLFIFY